MSDFESSVSTTSPLLLPLLPAKKLIPEGGKNYGDVVEGTLVKAQPITGCWGFERGKKEYLSVCLSFLLSVPPVFTIKYAS